MSRVRQAESLGGSLDLLLDTITNAFGGIVLLALLVVLLVNQSGPLPPQTDTSQSEDRTLELSELEAHRDSLRKSLASQDRLEDQFADPEVRALVHDLERRTQEFDTLATEVNQLQLEVRESAEREDKLNQRHGDLARAIETAKGEVDDLENRLDGERGKRRVTLDLPKEEPTYKAPVVFVVRHGELFSLDRNLGNEPFELNTDQFQKATLDPEIVLKAKHARVSSRPSTGISLSRRTEIERLLKQLDGDASYATFCVWNDSFDHFDAVREACLKLGLKYRVLPVTRGPIVEGPGTAGAQ